MVQLRFASAVQELYEQCMADGEAALERDDGSSAFAFSGAFDVIPACYALWSYLSILGGVYVDCMVCTCSVTMMLRIGEFHCFKMAGQVCKMPPSEG